MNKNKRDFNKDAVSWDDNPRRIKLADDLLDIMLSKIDLNSNMDLLDFGCGTGLLTLKLQPFVGSIVGVDSSEGMLEVLNKKIEKRKIKNIRKITLSIEDEDIISRSYDLIVTSMTLHHIEDVKSIVRLFYRLLKKTGYLCIFDLDSESGIFHSNNSGVFHYGFNRDNLKLVLKEIGFCNIDDITAAKAVKYDIQGKINNFSIFLMTAYKT